VERLGKYEIVDRIGVGGFGVVYRGYDPFIKRHVAIKTCSTEDTETRDRFLREAEIAGNLQHPNIVTVFEFGYHEETPYLVQEYLSGEDLDHKIKRRDAISLATKLDWLLDIARGLEAAHERGVVHRDVKPANIRILSDGSAKILDFGIARLASVNSSLTQAGVTLGTASYLAPEQIRGQAVDTRTDVFAFGVLAYELLTYERPFRAQDVSALFYQLLNEPAPSLEARAPGLPPALVDLVRRCLEKEAHRRFAPTRELVVALERLTRPPTGATPATDFETSETRRFEPPTEKRTIDPRAVSGPASADEPTMALGELEWNPEPSTTRPGLAATASGRRRNPLPWLLGVVAVLGVAAWFALRPGGAPSVVPAAAPLPAAPADEAPEPGSEPESTVVPETDAASAPDAEEAPASVSTPEPTPAPEPEPEPEPQPPPPPARGELLFGPAWDPTMTVRVGDRTLRLDREHRIEVPAGVVDLRFALDRPGYAVEQPMRLQLEPGASETVSIPIDRPGRLTVQPHLSSPPGTVRLDGQVLGASPIRGLWIAPGEHFLEVFGRGSEAPEVARGVVVASGVETVVTFDLSGRLDTLVVDRPLSEP